MATGCCSTVTFVGTCENNFYFQVAAETDVVGDCFKITERCLNRWVRSAENKFLHLCDEQFQVQNLSSDQLSQQDCQFKIQTYKDIPGGKGGMAAMLYVIMNEKNMVACCSQQNDVYPEEMTPPSSIEETEHKAVFYMTHLTASKTYMFESSMYPSYFLGFESDGDNPSLQKLVLRHKDNGTDEPDEACEVTLLNDFKMS
ncbi:interleukin-18-like [Sebastes umbrosus]|uniref:interleukin-18-like n=1 Tax=Sebastes umbrosus TaxID=72105 RepID=UPI00189C7A96|nr:interleukin-18-like [Sebastes umbrosus]